MPKYHFPIVDGTKLSDPTGVSLRNDKEAKDHGLSPGRLVLRYQERPQRCRD